MDFLISRTHIEPVWLIAIGFSVGLMGGFFGVGGSFLVGPCLFALGLPMNFVVGTDLAHIVGKSLVGARRHRALGHVDLKLAVTMLAGTLVGVELGAQVIEQLKRRSHMEIGVGTGFVVVLLAVSAFMTWESLRTIRARRVGGHPLWAVPPLTSNREEPSSFMGIAQCLRRVSLGPFVSLPASNIARILVLIIILVGFVGGFFSGFLGGGAGYIRMPAMVYLLGIPTHIAVGTDLFEVVISAGYGTLTHAIKGNVDIMIALVMHTGAAVGAQIGAICTQYFAGARIRLAFAPVPLLGAAIIIYGMLKR